MGNCGHGCCRIRTNGYHAHLRPPDLCHDCRAIGDGDGEVHAERDVAAVPGNGPERS